jgi:hypothetical protein
MGGKGEVKRQPDIERWNHVRDNIDQVFDPFKPDVMLKIVVFVVVGPALLYKHICNEGLIPNGDESSGVRPNYRAESGQKPAA